MQEITLSSKLGKGRLSASGNYLVLASNTKWLYVKAGATEPRYCLLAGDSLKYSGATYNAYAPRSSFLRDCLHSAEEVMKGSTLETGKVQSKVAGTTTQFGVSDKANITAANAHHTDANAAPSIGQAYVIVATDPKATYPYHAAGVVAADGSDQATIEVFARETDASDRNASGAFDMYTVGDTDASFHGRWKTLDLFGTGGKPLTVVIASL